MAAPVKLSPITPLGNLGFRLGLDVSIEFRALAIGHIEFLDTGFRGCRLVWGLRVCIV